MPRPSRRLVLAGLLLLVAALVGPWSPVSPLRRLERSIVFRPHVYPAGDWEPDDLKFEDARFAAADGTRLHGWYLPHAEPRGVALYCHGNAGNVAMWAKSLRPLVERHGLSVLVFDYRGYGRSEGTPSEAGLYQDARAARKWLAERAGVAEREIILLGRSLGGGVATELAARDGARALILESTFTSLPDVGVLRMPWLLPHWTMSLRMDSLSKIGRFAGPLLVSHGDRDEVIPFAHGEQLFAAATGPKEFFRFEGGGHRDAFSAEYRDRFEQFLTSVIGPK